MIVLVRSERASIASEPAVCICVVSCTSLAWYGRVTSTCSSMEEDYMRPSWQWDATTPMWCVILKTPRCAPNGFCCTLSPVCLSHGWISQKRLKLGSCNFHHRVAPWLISSWLKWTRNFKGNIGSGGAK